MKKLYLAIMLVIIGFITFAITMTTSGWDFNVFNTATYETKVHEINEEFTNINIVSDTTDINIVPSLDGKCKVECYETENIDYIVIIENNTLNISENDQRKWYNHIGINNDNNHITVYLPNLQYNDISIKLSTGDVNISHNFTFSNLNIKVSTGDITLEKIISTNINLSSSTGDKKLNDISCMNLTSDGSTSKLTMKNVIVYSKLNVKHTTGDVKFDGLDAAEIIIKTSTGDVEGTLYSSKIFICSTSTGKIRVPETYEGGVCKITTSTGDIKISIK